MINYALHLGITYVDRISRCKRIRYGDCLVVAPCASIKLKRQRNGGDMGLSIEARINNNVHY